MNNDLQVIWILLLINLAATIAFLIISFIKNDKKRGLILSAFFLLTPIFGISFILIGELTSYIVNKYCKGVFSFDDIFEKRSMTKFITDIDIEKELNTVPIEEAMNMSNKKERRQAFLDILKDDDYDQLIGNISNEVTSEDTEISHYAATFVTDTIARYKSRETELRMLIEEHPSLENKQTYINYTTDILDKNLFSRVELKKYNTYMDEIASDVFSQAPECLSDSSIAVLLNGWRRLKNKQKYAFWLMIARQRCSYSLPCFKLCMAAYYKDNNRKALFLLLDEVKRSDLVLDSESLDWIRFFKKPDNTTAKNSAV